jgi:hypothetical protein
MSYSITVVNYKTPAYHHKHIDWNTVSETDAQEYQRQFDEVNAENKVIHDDLVEKLKRAKALVVEIFGDKSVEVKYFSKKCIATYQLTDPPMERWRKANAERLKKDEEERRHRESMTLIEQKTERAIIWLQARGKVLGTDFTVKTAYSVANDIAFDEAVEEHKGIYISFAGDESCEDCRGYDGLSNRCDCGSRRVSYVMPDWADFEDMCVIAEAY